MRFRFKKTKILALTLFTTTLSLPAVFAQDAPSTISAPDSTSPNKDSEYEFGKNFLNGRAVEKNPEKALEHFNQAAELGHTEAPGAIGFFYAAGLVVEKDDAKAAEWFQKGSEKGSAAAKYNLGKFHLDGRGGLSDSEKGLALMEVAASLGLPEAHATLADIYFLGEYSQKTDYKKAAPHVKVVAESGNISGINMLGYMLQYGLGMEKDEKKAEEYLRQAAQKGDPKAQHNLGQLLDPRSEDKTRRIEATAWLIIASSQTEPLATRRIGEIELTMPKKEFNAAKDMADKLQKSIAEEAQKPAP
jgi:TPR repeat protein